MYAYHCDFFFYVNKMYKCLSFVVFAVFVLPKKMLFHGNNSLIYTYKYTHYHTLNNTHMASQSYNL